MPLDHCYEVQHSTLKQRLLIQLTVLLGYLMNILAQIADSTIPIPYHTLVLTGEA